MPGYRNYASADNTWIFWATRVAPSKDNFWSEISPVIMLTSALGRHIKTSRLGVTTPIVQTTGLTQSCTALLLFCPHVWSHHLRVANVVVAVVGLGDYLGMVNQTLIHALARSDGTILQP